MAALMLDSTAPAYDGALVRKSDTSSALMIVKDGQRCWVHAPDGVTASASLPLLLVLHGAGKNKF